MAHSSPYMVVSVAILRASVQMSGSRPGAAPICRKPAKQPNMPFNVPSREARFGDKI
jgi:hypothetical protein